MSTNGSTVSYSGIVGAGQTLPVAVTGSFFYFPVATLPLFARPSGGVFCQYVAGTGLEDQSPGFTVVEVNNPNKVPIVFQIVAGSEGFIDRRLIQNSNVQNVILAQNSAAPPWIGSGGSWVLDLPDQSGLTFTDGQGNSWIGIQRVLLSVQTHNPGAVCAVGLPSGAQLISLVESITAAGDTLPPQTFSASGPFVLSYQGTLLQASVYEIYQAIAPGFAGNPPS